MRQAQQLQDIEEMRREQGIDDVELRLGIRALRIGDCIKLSLLSSAHAFETVQVRITSIRGSAFRGKLAKQKNGTAAHADVSTIAFTTAHIHSIVKKESNHEQR